MRDISIKKENMRDFSIVKQRILQFLEDQGVTKYEFYQKTGVSNGILSQKNGLSEDNILRFLNTYSNVNANWLLKGKGKMLQEDSELQSAEAITPYEKKLDRVDEIISRLEKLENRIAQDQNLCGKRTSA